MEDVWSTKADESEVLDCFEKELQKVRDRSTSMEIDDWAIENGLKFNKEDFVYTLDPSEDVDESNWREKGWFRKYDARDELHRSPDKLKMIERMEQFPDENWGQEEGFSQDAKKHHQTESDSLEITTPDNLPGDPQPEASDHTSQGFSISIGPSYGSEFTMSARR